MLLPLRQSPMTMACCIRVMWQRRAVDKLNKSRLNTHRTKWGRGNAAMHNLCTWTCQGGSLECHIDGRGQQQAHTLVGYRTFMSMCYCYFTQRDIIWNELPYIWRRKNPPLKILLATTSISVSTKLRLDCAVYSNERTRAYERVRNKVHFWSSFPPQLQKEKEAITTCYDFARPRCVIHAANCGASLDRNLWRNPCLLFQVMADSGGQNWLLHHTFSNQM